MHRTSNSEGCRDVNTPRIILDLFALINPADEISAGFKPFMEYAGSYALFNYRLEDPSKGLEYDNLRLIRAFECGLDPTSSEAGFVLVHIAMVKQSGALVEGAASMLDACAARDRERFNDGLRTLVGALSKINGVMNSECTILQLVAS
jgi:indoleamine 2,3-dioxygenase